MEWQPIETYDELTCPFFVLVSYGNLSTMGVKRKYWHDLSDGDYMITSPMIDQPTHWMPLPNPPKEQKPFKCPISYPGCTENCFSYGCGN